ncbi:M56 family metallopeptidase [Streptomyces sp. MST-110588]|uniref:M56 family metallopeptidase n=1 Tax=Streptomyces sp. MST-110588 TaxID=2833628 RepID=UPI001F5C1977|nr:M56 family metallopeptidase [Streptomyces sp. MST-110588]UNO42207.1 M56 family metallopeptidase [Streptomyces sp. MST-110588]
MATALLVPLLLVPLLLPFAVAPLARRVLAHLAPVPALWVLTVGAAALTGCSLAALGGFLLTGLLKLPLFAELDHLVHPLRTPSDYIVVPAAAAAVGALTVTAWTIARWALRQSRHLRTARSAADRRPAAGDLCVLESPYPDAYALPGKPNRIVVTTAMLRSLGPGEREALFAHERAHNAGRHHYFLAVAELAAHCHPALRPARAAIRLAVERVADESAAAAVGDRRLTARAIGRAALAGRSTTATRRPPLAPAATTGPVPQRVAALLAPPRRGRRAAAVGAGLLLAVCVTASAGAVTTGALAVHHEVEVAQGEARR